MSSRRGSNLVPILPAGDAGRAGPASNLSSPDGGQPTPPKRSAVLVACQGCRRKRIKCGGQRPSCNQCVNRGEDCAYVAEAGETVTLALRRRITELERDNARYQELFQLLRERPENEAYEILRRIREAGSTLDAWGFIKQAELLLSTPPSAPESTEGSSTPRQGRLYDRREDS